MMDEVDIARAKEREEMLVARTLAKIRQQVVPSEGMAREPYCEDCGEEIPLPRLKAMPSTTRCIDCQTIAERRH